MLPAILARRVPKRSYDAVGKSALNMKVTPCSTLLHISQTKPTAWLRGGKLLVPDNSWILQQNKRKLFHGAMLSPNTAALCSRHVKNLQLAHHQSCRELPMQRKWPWKFHCASGSKAVSETDKQKWQPYCESVCLSFAHRSQPLPEGGFMMTALILSCESSSVFHDFPNTIRAQPQVIVPGPLENSYLRGLTRYCSMKAIFFLS